MSEVIVGMDAPKEDPVDPVGRVDPAELLATAQRLVAKLTAHVEAAKAAAAEVSESRRLTAQTLSDAQASAAEIAGVGTLMLAAKARVVDDQAVIATKSDHIQEAQEHADKVRGDLDRTATAAGQQVIEIESAATRAKTASDNAANTLAEIAATKVAALAEGVAVLTARDAAREASDVTKSLADKSKLLESTLSLQEADLKRLNSEAAKQLEEIVRLLPGATSAGLAHAFDQRRQTFLTPGQRWQWLFVASVLSLVLLAAWGLYLAGSAASYDELFRLWIARLPIAGALIWLALHSSRESALAKRLEEDYGYKAAVASSFQGFHQQMERIEAAADTKSPLAQLCEDTLATIGLPPGRIYDKHRLTITPSSEATAAAKATVQEIGKIAAPAK
jgi:hypothetical protein